MTSSGTVPDLGLAVSLAVGGPGNAGAATSASGPVAGGVVVVVVVLGPVVVGGGTFTTAEPGDVVGGAAVVAGTDVVGGAAVVAGADVGGGADVVGETMESVVRVATVSGTVLVGLGGVVVVLVGSGDGIPEPASGD